MCIFKTTIPKDLRALINETREHNKYVGTVNWALQQHETYNKIHVTELVRKELAKLLSDKYPATELEHAIQFVKGAKNLEDDAPLAYILAIALSESNKRTFQPIKS